MIGVWHAQPRVRPFLLAGVAASLLAASCATSPRVEVAAPSSTTAREIATTAPPATAFDPPTTSSTNASPVEDGTALPNESAEETTPSSNSEGLLAGGVDPSTLFRSPEGDVLVQPTPAALVNRSLPTNPLLAPPSSDAFESTIEAFDGAPLEASTWNELCPVPPEELRYVTVSFWGFDGLHHRGELIVAASEADKIVGVFSRLHAIRFPIEEMRLITPADLFGPRTGDGNNTASYVCREVTGGTRFSEHSFGLAIDINPFQNPYVFNEIVIPSLSSSFLDRDVLRAGMIVRGDPVGDEVIAAFADAGWAWGGDWNTLQDYQHFAKNNR